MKEKHLRRADFRLSRKFLRVGQSKHASARWYSDPHEAIARERFDPDWETVMRTAGDLHGQDCQALLSTPKQNLGIKIGTPTLPVSTPACADQQ